MSPGLMMSSVGGGSACVTRVRVMVRLRVKVRVLWAAARPASWGWWLSLRRRCRGGPVRCGARQLHILTPCEKVGAAQDVGTDLHRCDLRQQ
eukprot:scaffold45579_cov67-Phaeocystis_antarctica.AAC.3